MSGLNVPRLTTIERDALPSPTTDQIIFNTDTSSHQSWNGATWDEVSGGGGGGTLNDVVDDTTPQLGGDLDTNGFDIIVPPDGVDVILTDNGVETLPIFIVNAASGTGTSTGYGFKGSTGSVLTGKIVNTRAVGALYSLNFHTFNLGGLFEAMRIDDQGRMGLGANVSAPATSLLALDSTDKGFLAPRMTTVQRDAIITPAEGLMIYNTDSTFYEFFDGTIWDAIKGGAGGLQDLIDDVTPQLGGDLDTNGFDINVPAAGVDVIRTNAGFETLPIATVNLSSGLGTASGIAFKVSSGGVVTGKVVSTRIGGNAYSVSLFTFNSGGLFEAMRVDDQGRMGLGTNVAAPSTSILSLDSTDKGFLAPRMTTIQRDAITTPAEGLMIYNTDSTLYEFFDGTIWGAINGGGGGGYETIEQEGVALTQRTTIDFQGAGVTATDDGGQTIVTIPGGGGGSLSTTRVRRITSSQAMPTGVPTAVSWNSEEIDGLSIFDPGTPDRFTIAATGEYLIGVEIIFGTSSTDYQWEVSNNGMFGGSGPNNIMQESFLTSANQVHGRRRGTSQVSLTVGDVIRLGILPLNPTTNVNVNTLMWITQLS